MRHCNIDNSMLVCLKSVISSLCEICVSWLVYVNYRSPCHCLCEVCMSSLVYLKSVSYLVRVMKT